MPTTKFGCAPKSKKSRASKVTMTLDDDYMDKALNDETIDMEVDRSRLAKVGMEMVNGYCHITYAYHNEKEDHLFVAGARKNIVIGNWKSNGS